MEFVKGNCSYLRESRIFLEHIPLPKSEVSTTYKKLNTKQIKMINKNHSN